MSEMTTAQALLTTDVPIVSVTQAAQVVQALYGLTTLVAAPRRAAHAVLQVIRQQKLSVRDNSLRDEHNRGYRYRV
ncbi:hypothetical protein [Yersinia pseudotuberculosis]|uniref:hypothetical protein n=1 Tax=Yersinia pseudotuberculosis TaxID=633 RepID=UPI0038B4B1E0